MGAARGVTETGTMYGSGVGALALANRRRKRRR